MHPLLNIALLAARKAGRIILHGFDRLDLVKTSEKSQNDFVTDIDKKAEQEIIYHIRKTYPNHGVLAEESGNIKGNEFVWIIDPLDGTTNFIHGLPHFAISIAIQIKGQVEHGLIFDPIRDECFTATRGEGAQCNNRRIRVSEQSQLHRALLATGFPFRNQHLYETYMQILKSITEQTFDIRRAGSAALDLAYVAAGRMDGYWEFNLAPWDIAAGALMVREAGGYVSDFSGQDRYLENGNILAANAKIFRELLNHIKPLV